MKTNDSVWQGHFSYWQNLFIHQNVLAIGYTAWKGYLDAGRGMVVCEVVDAVPSYINWSIDTVIFNQAFISQALAADCLRGLELKEAVNPLLDAITTYDPTQAIVVLVIGNGAVDINLLQHLAIPPADCYEQVQRRWAEFQLGLQPKRVAHE